MIAIFDMDGTLIDSAKDITISINAVRRRHHNLDELSEDFVIEAINREKRNLAALFYGTEVYENADREYFEAHYHEQCVQNVRLYEGIKESLFTLRDKKVRLSVATNAPTKFAQRMLASCGVSEVFDFIIGADSVSNPKPDKEMLERILKGYGYRAGQKAVMIGDNSKDMQAAESAGIEGAFVTWGFSPSSEHHRIWRKPHEIVSYFD
jgi:phosphoglycolate phosphatase